MRFKLIWVSYCQTQVPQMFVFSEQDNAEYANYMRLHNFRKELQTAGRNWAELNEAEQYLLQSIAEANTGRSSAMAQGVLCFFYNLCTEQEINLEVPPSPSNRKEEEHPQSKQFDLKRYNLTVYPNPAHTEVFITVSNSHVKIDRVELCDLVGRQVQMRVFEKSHVTFPIE